MRDGTYFFRSRAQVFWVGRRCYTISINRSTWFIVCFFSFGCLYFVWHYGTAVRQNSNYSWWRRFLIQHVSICNLICLNGFWLYLTFLKLHDKQIVHLYDIEIFVQIILIWTALPRTSYLTSNFNSLILVENSHWLFHLDWLFEIWTDPDIFQNLILE